MPSLLRTESARLEVYKAQLNQVKLIGVMLKSYGCAVEQYSSLWKLLADAKTNLSKLLPVLFSCLFFV